MKTLYALRQQDNVHGRMSALINVPLPPEIKDIIIKWVLVPGRDMASARQRKGATYIIQDTAGAVGEVYEDDVCER